MKEIFLNFDSELSEIKEAAQMQNKPIKEVIKGVKEHMKIIQDFIDEVETALDKYATAKYGHIDLGDNAELEIFNELKYFFKKITEDAEELDSTIDAIIEEVSEPSTYEEDCKADDKRHEDNRDMESYIYNCQL